MFGINLNFKNMAIKKVWIEDGCTSCGLCSDICPEVFEMPDEAKVIKGVNYSDFESEIKDAADSCPVEIIKFD
jgi:ferredoxin